MSKPLEQSDFEKALAQATADMDWFREEETAQRKAERLEQQAEAGLQTSWVDIIEQRKR